MTGRLGRPELRGDPYAVGDRLTATPVEAAPDAIVLVDATGAIVLVNRQAEEMFGYDRRQLLGRSVEQLLPERFRVVHRAHRMRYRTDPRPRAMGASLQLLGLRADGREFPVEISLSPIDSDRGARVVATVRDITERVNAETRTRDITSRLGVDARERRATQELRVLEDRERMARDLHDLVIQRLFATGMAMQALQTRLDDPDLSMRALEIVSNLDETIREIRMVIFALQAPVGRDDYSLRRRILSVTDDERRALGFTPHVHFEGLLDDADDEIAHHLLAMLRETLSNIAKHAQATAVEIRVESRNAGLALHATDNGIGIDPANVGGGNGLRNMTERAASVGGIFTIVAGPEGGTIVECLLPKRRPG